MSLNQILALGLADLDPGLSPRCQPVADSFEDAVDHLGPHRTGHEGDSWFLSDICGERMPIALGNVRRISHKQIDRPFDARGECFKKVTFTPLDLKIQISPVFPSNNQGFGRKFGGNDLRLWPRVLEKERESPRSRAHVNNQLRLEIPSNEEISEVLRLWSGNQNPGIDIQGQRAKIDCSLQVLERMSVEAQLGQPIH